MSDGEANLKIAVFGLGFVGTSIASAWLRAGAIVEGFDISAERISALKNPSSINFEQAVEQAFERGLNTGKLSLYTLNEAPKTIQADVKFVCVPVYLSEKDKNADLTFLKSAARSVGATLKNGDAVVICPSVPPGTTRKIVLPLLEEASGLSTEKGDFDLIYSPERILVGRAVEDIEDRYPAVISGINAQSLERAETLYLNVAQKGVIKMPNIETAEFEKLAEGVYRDVNVAVANELAMACDELGVNYWSVREAANSQPFCHLHLPGLGVGGACIPVYPWFVAKAVKKTGAKIIEDSREINDSMVNYLVTSLINNFKVSKDTRVGILGLAFRGGVADSRMSVTYRLVEKLRASGLYRIKVHDPLIHGDARLGEILTSNLQDVISNSDIVVIATDHKIYGEYQWNSIAERPGENKLKVIDTKGILLGGKFSHIEVFGLGYGGPDSPKLFESA
jgi:nucleotide sugar dehydrogenase